MGILLNENTPRPWTWAYGIHRARAVVRIQVPWVLPVGVGIFYQAVGTLAASHAGLTGDFATTIGISLATGLPAALGASALWRWLSARLYPWLDAHPQSPAAIEAGYRLPSRPVFANAPGIILGESHPLRHYRRDGGYSQEHRTDEAYSITPEWSVLPAASLVTGLLVLGSIGSGKTKYVLQPSVFQLFHHPSRVGGLVMDSKSALVEPLVEEMTEAGRLEDVLPVGPKSKIKWNPLHAPLAAAAAIADQLLTTIENINSAPYSSDSRWIRNGSAHLAEGAIGLLRLRSGYVTALALRLFLGELIATTQGSDEPGIAAGNLIAALFAGSTIQADEQEQFQHFRGLVVSRMSEDEKFRAIYSSELLSLLVPLTSPGVVHLYNAPADELDMPSWSEAIDKGLVVVLDCNSRDQPGLATVLGMLLKLGYENSMLARLSWARQGLCNADRYMALVIDEYQDFTSPGDSDYLALCRESKSMTVFLTQGHSSIIQKIGEDRMKVLLQSMRNRLVLNQSVPEFASDLLGQREYQELDRSIQESIQDASLAATGRFAGDSSVSESLNLRRERRHSVAAEELAALPLGQGILQSHDGERSVPLHRVFLRPVFAMGRRYIDQHPRKES